MNAAEVIAALSLPSGTMVHQRVPKKLLIEHGSPTAADRRHITDGIDELSWVAALKPATIGVPEFRDDERAYVEIAVLRMTLRAAAKGARLAALVHRAIPYPVLLVFAAEQQTVMSVAHIRWSQAGAGKTVLDGDIVAVEVGAEAAAADTSPFREALSLARQPQASLYAVYQGWLDTLVALQASRITGRFRMPDSSDAAAARRGALQELSQLDAGIARLRSAASAETQIARRVDVNLEIRRLEAARLSAQGRL